MDKAARRELLDYHTPLLLPIARHAVGPDLRAKVDPEELVQTVLLKADREFDKLRGNTLGELKAWLCDLLRSEASRLYRSFFKTQKRDIHREQPLGAEADSSADVPPGPVAIDDHTTPSRNARRNEEDELVRKALAELPEHYRTVIVLREFESLTHAEIADKLGDTVDAVKNVYYRALQMLGSKLEHLR
jgi:RNA polymerase sigma-70 factor (ECF subfamily)